MRPSLGVLGAIYADALNTIPYSSAVPMFRIAGVSIDPKFGCNCIDQNSRIQTRLEGVGFDSMRYLRDTSLGRHHPLIVDFQNEPYFIDAYLMSEEPVNLNAVKRNGGSMEVDAFPHLNGEKSKLLFSFDGFETSFNVHKFWPKSTRKDTFYFDFNYLDNTFPTFDEYKVIALHPIQETLSLRVLDVEKGRVDHLIFPIGPGRIDRGVIYVKTNEGTNVPMTSESEFEEALHPISLKTQISMEDLVDFINQSADIYFQLKPGNLLKPQ
tara:strand:- start:3062 stop:3865 length:804 start_codon:yes stop_codon:yes gene_type:complete